jgi:hypothetical protein
VADIGGALGGTNHYMFIMIGIPMAVTLLTHSIERIEKPPYLFAVGSRFQIWQVHLIMAFSLSLILTVLIIIESFFIGFLMVGFENTWINASGTIAKTLKNMDLFQSIVNNLVSFKVIGTIFITKFLGFLMICLSFLFLKQLLNQTVLIMLILISLAGIDQIGVLSFPIYTWNGVLTIYNWLSPSKTMFHSIYLAAISLMLYGVSGWLYERKDFI